MNQSALEAMNIIRNDVLTKHEGDVSFANDKPVDKGKALAFGVRCTVSDPRNRYKAWTDVSNVVRSTCKSHGLDGGLFVRHGDPDRSDGFVLVNKTPVAPPAPSATPEAPTDAPRSITPTRRNGSGPVPASQLDF